MDPANIDFHCITDIRPEFRTLRKVLLQQPQIYLLFATAVAPGDGNFLLQADVIAYCTWWAERRGEPIDVTL